MIKLFSKKPRRPFSAKDILSVLDETAANFQFPMLDNGYIYLAASRLSLFRSAECWAIVFETFGFSPRAGHPDLSITTISNKLYNRNPPSDYVSPEAYQSYLSNNPNSEMRFFWPISNTEWIDENDPESVVSSGVLDLRGRSITIPEREEIEAAGIDIEADRIAVFELCRFLATKYREDVLGNETERRVSIYPDMERIMKLDEWHHPDLAAGQLPSQTITFEKIASVLESGTAGLYEVSEEANNHWKNWPDGGLL